jgi:hypothetical protein
MRKAAPPAILLIALLALSAAPVSFAGVPGFVAYHVQFSTNGTTKSFVVNETVGHSSAASKDALTLAFAFGGSNLTYSRLVNASTFVQPFLPSISNQTLTYKSSKGSVSLSVSQAGTLQQSFHGTTYELSGFLFDAQVAAGNRSGHAVGRLYAFPSGLVYSVNASTGPKISVSAVVVSTNLPLDLGTTSPGLQAASMGIGLGLAGGALALGLGVRNKRRSQQTSKNQPEHWVD